ncbi:MAG: polysaccharide biosynthesis tyrosine autokinase [Bacteroidaceae bacterium]|nr:polysaccharide biosynthesis tyrosine autokinase [Bacteroidaceae bacterium]
MANNRANNKKNDNVIPIRDLIFYCLKNWYWFVISLTIALGVAAYYIKSTPPKYVRYAEVLIKESGQNRGGGTGSTFKEMGNSRTTANAQNEIIALQSVEIMKETIRRLGLEVELKGEGRLYNGIIYSQKPFKIVFADLNENDKASFTATITTDSTVTLKDFVFNGELQGNGVIVANIGDTISTPVGKIIINKTEHIGAFKNNIYVEKHNIDMFANTLCSNLKASIARKRTSIVGLTFKDISTIRATDILTTILEIYNEKWVEESNYATIKTADFIGKRAEEIRLELETIDREIAKFRGDNKLSRSTSTLVQEAVSSKNQELQISLNNQLELANFIKSYMIQSGNKEIIPANTGISAANVEALISSYNTKVLERNRLVANSSESNPVVKDYDKDIAAMYAGIQTAIESHIKDLERQIAEADKEVESSITRITTTTHSSKELQTLIRQQKVKSTLYLFLLQKLEETELSKEFSASNNRILAPPTGSNTPVEPMQKQIIMLALTLGTLLPLIVIFICVITNNKVRGRRDLEELNIPFIGEIPLYKESKRSAGKQGERRIIVKGGSRNIINEAFRVMRTNFEFMNDKDKKSTVILTTSFNPGSGKTFLTLNLGAALAIKGSKVLVIDGDLRRASASEYVQSASGGLSEYLSGGTTNINGIITTDTGYANLHIITVGTPPPNPTELIGSKHFETLIAEMRERYDYIFIDCPPIDIVADTQIIEKYCDRTLFVIRAGLLNRDMLGELQDIYDNKRFKSLAIILNGTHSGTGKYGYRYGYSYGYGYGYGYGYHYHSKK